MAVKKIELFDEDEDEAESGPSKYSAAAVQNLQQL